MSEVKCVCHINGYQIKDSVARGEIEKIKNGDTQVQKAYESVLAQYDMNGQRLIGEEEFEETCGELEDRIAILESSAGGGSVSVTYNESTEELTIG